MRGLSDRARANQHKQRIRDDTHKGKRIKLAKREIGARIVSDEARTKDRGRGRGNAPTDRGYDSKEAFRGTGRWRDI
eukprot:6204062-Pleurochrysis_carterae.AAC.2